MTLPVINGKYQHKLFEKQLKCEVKVREHHLKKLRCFLIAFYGNPAYNATGKNKQTNPHYKMQVKVKPITLKKEINITDNCACCYW